MRSDLAGQDSGRLARPTRPRTGDEGFLMVALLMGMAVTAVWMSTMLPAWHQQAVREKEADLIFRGEQYARAIALFFRKNQTLPPSIDVLVSQRYLRKKYKDPITGEDFLSIGGALSAIGGRGQGGAADQPQPDTPSLGRNGGRGQAQAGLALEPGVPAGISGVRSRSTATSIRIYRNQQSYAQFPFDYTIALQQMGVAPTQQGPGARSGGGVEMTPIVPAGPSGLGRGRANPGRGGWQGGGGRDGRAGQGPPRQSTGRGGR